jgi:hypothetical protein
MWKYARTIEGKHTVLQEMCNRFPECLTFVPADKLPSVRSVVGQGLRLNDAEREGEHFQQELQKLLLPVQKRTRAQSLHEH